MYRIPVRKRAYSASDDGSNHNLNWARGILYALPVGLLSGLLSKDWITGVGAGMAGFAGGASNLLPGVQQIWPKDRTTRIGMTSTRNNDGSFSPQYRQYNIESGIDNIGKDMDY